MIDPKNRTNRTPVHESMPKGVREFGEDVEKNPSGPAVAADPPDLVNREEFDVQTQVLLRTRELALLEQRMAELESKLSATPAAKQEDE